jgi:hypothetical protein
VADQKTQNPLRVEFDLLPDPVNLQQPRLAAIPPPEIGGVINFDPAQ